MFRLDVECYLRDEPVSAVAPSPWYAIRKLARRYRVALFIGSSLLLILMIAVVVRYGGRLLQVIRYGVSDDYHDLESVRTEEERGQ